MSSGRLDALGDDVELQRRRQREGGSHHGQRTRVALGRPVERSVELQRPDRQRGEFGCGGLADAEVVDGDPHPDRPERLDLPHGA